MLSDMKLENIYIGLPVWQNDFGKITRVEEYTPNIFSKETGIRIFVRWSTGVTSWNWWNLAGANAWTKTIVLKPVKYF